VEGERATWHLVQLTGRRGEAAGGEKRRRRKEKGDEEEEVGDIASADSVTRWFGIFNCLYLKTNKAALIKKRLKYAIFRNCFYLVLNGNEMRPTFLEDILIRLKSGAQWFLTDRKSHRTIPSNFSKRGAYFCVCGHGPFTNF
jgi:hypothetical protein